jgi:hypothetical protein
MSKLISVTTFTSTAPWSGPITAYGVFGENTVEVIASDTAGDASQPGTTTIFF